MAKSIRSKWKRKCRAIKRERYGKKELERLKKTLGIVDEPGTSAEATMKDMSEVITFTTVSEIKEKKAAKEAETDIMDQTDIDDIKKKFNPKTLRNENGAYPVWLHPRKIRKGKKSKKKKEKSKGKVTKKTGS